MKIKNVIVNYPEDMTELNERYADAVAKIIIKRVPPEYLDELIKKLREEANQ